MREVPQNPKSGELKVAQVNAENLFLYFDDELPADWKSLSERRWQKLSRATVSNKPLRKALWLAESLLDIDADIILVNEVGGEESLANFARFFLEDRYATYLIEGNSDRGIDIGYLVKRDLPVRCELVSHKDRPLGFLYPHDLESNRFFETTQPEKVLRSRYFSRDCLRLNLYKDGSITPDVVFLLVHLKSKLDPDGIDPEGKERRKAELSALVEIYKETRAERPGVPVIVGGDFNGQARKELCELELQAILDDTDLSNALETVGRSMEESMTQLLFDRLGVAVSLQIDYLFLSPEFSEHLRADGCYVYRYKSDLGVELPRPRTLDQRLYMPSDHYPVVVTFTDFLGLKAGATL